MTSRRTSRARTIMRQYPSTTVWLIFITSLTLILSIIDLFVSST